MASLMLLLLLTSYYFCWWLWHKLPALSAVPLTNCYCYCPSLSVHIGSSTKAGPLSLYITESVVCFFVWWWCVLPFFEGKSHRRCSLQKGTWNWSSEETWIYGYRYRYRAVPVLKEEAKLIALIYFDGFLIDHTYSWSCITVRMRSLNLANLLWGMQKIYCTTNNNHQ